MNDKKAVHRNIDQNDPFVSRRGGRKGKGRRGGTSDSRATIAMIALETLGHGLSPL